MRTASQYRVIIILCVCVVSPIQGQNSPDPTELILKAINHWRGVSSWAQIEMTVHRPEWERSMSMDSWTRGEQDALIRLTAPQKDAGNATLKLDQAMWIFTPKLNQVIKLPASMMAQSWLGSDFSYNDLAKSDQIHVYYTHRLINSFESDGHRAFTVEAIPKADAPVVWGKEILTIRDDYVLLEESFYDQSMVLLKRMETTAIRELGGRPYPVEMIMYDLEDEDHWTKIKTSEARFDLDLPSWIFTQSNLRNPRPWQLKP